MAKVFPFSRLNFQSFILASQKSFWILSLIFFLFSSPPAQGNLNECALILEQTSPKAVLWEDQPPTGNENSGDESLTIETLAKDTLLYIKNIQSMRDPHQWHFVEYPKDTHPTLLSWKQATLKKLALLSRSQLEALKWELNRIPDSPLVEGRLPSRLATQFWNQDEALLAFVLRDDAFLKARLNFIFKDFVHLELIDYLRLAEAFETPYLISLFYPYLNNYLNQNKEPQEGQVYTLPRKRMSDMIITFLALKDLPKHHILTDSYYLDYLASVKKLIGHDPTFLAADGRKNLEFLQDIHSHVKTLITKGSLSPKAQLIFWGSFFNGRAHTQSDFDYEEFYTEDRAEPQPEQNTEKPKRLSDFLNRLIRKTYGLTLPMNEHSGSWSTPSDLIDFGLHKQGFVFSVNEKGAFAHFRSNWQSETFETRALFTDR